MRSDIAQEIEIIEPAQPVGIIDHDSIGRAVPESEEALEDLSDADQVFHDLLLAEKRARRVAETRITQAACRTAEQSDGFVTGLLEPPQHHDRNEMADMQAVGGEIKAVVRRA